MILKYHHVTVVEEILSLFRCKERLFILSINGDDVILRLILIRRLRILFFKRKKVINKFY